MRELELRILHWIACGEDAVRDTVAHFANDWWFGIPMFVLVALLVATTARGRALLPRIVIACALGVGLAQGFRALAWSAFPRARPASSFREDQILRGPIQRATCAEHPEMWVERGHPPKEPSFPSSHVITTAAAAVAIGFGSRWAAAILWLYALAVGWGRMYWGKHWPSDVLGSLVLGGLAGWAGWRL